MGKWEALIKTGINLIEDLEIMPVNKATNKLYQNELGVERYIIKLIEEKTRPELIKVQFRLNKEERHKRELLKNQG